MNKATQAFILSYADADVHTLILNASKYPDVDMALAVRQIEGRQKTKKKIPSFFACEELLYPVKLSLEQASSETTAKHKTAYCNGEVLLDLTGGFGVDSCFFSSVFDKVVYVERQKALCELAEHNFNRLHRNNIEVVCETAERYLVTAEVVDWIYLDPARRTASGRKVVLLSDCEPDVERLAERLLEKAPNVMIKLSPMLDVTHVVNALPCVAQVHIVAVANECKELIVILKRDAAVPPRLVAVNYNASEGKEEFVFYAEDEGRAEVAYVDRLGAYLYEPNAAIMKSGAFKLIGTRMELFKLHVNSHLYTSDRLIDDFPGRVFRVGEVYDLSKQSLLRLRSTISKAHIAVRNFPLSADDLRKRLKIASGGNIYLFATTLCDGKKAIVSTEKVTL